MEYLKYFNMVCEALEESSGGQRLPDEIMGRVRVAVHLAYKEGHSVGNKAAVVSAAEPYEEGRMVGHSLGYIEGLQAGKVAKKQRLLNAYGGR